MRQSLNLRNFRQANVKRHWVHPWKFILLASFSVVLTTGLMPLHSLSAATQIDGVNYISEIQGSAQLSRSGGAFQQAYSSDFLEPGDQLRVAAGSNVLLVCSHGRSVLLDAGTHDVGLSCNLTRRESVGESVWEWLFSWPSRRQPSRTFNARIPYVITPRNTSLVEVSQPTISWNPIEDAQQYQVIVTGRGGEDVWESEWLSGSEVIYSGPLLFPETRYRIKVVADNGLSSSSDIVGFTLLSDAEAARVETQVCQLQSLKQDADNEALGLALLYQGYEHSEPDKHSNELSQAALDVLQGRIDTGTENSQVYLLQGDIYLSIGLPLQAEEQYERSLAFATDANQLERQANSLEGLGTVAEGKSEISEAISHFESALEIYEQLGASVAAADMQSRIDFLQN